MEKEFAARSVRGLLLGRKDLIDAAVKNNSPYSNTVGRGMKVAKEEIVGMVAAVDWLLAQDEDAMQKEFHRRAERIAARVKSLPSVETQISVPPVANHVPHLLITYDPNRIKLTGKEVMEKMREGKPRIELNPATGGRSASRGLECGAEHDCGGRVDAAARRGLDRCPAPARSVAGSGGFLNGPALVSCPTDQLTVPLSPLGERVAREGAFARRSGTGEGVPAGRSL